MAIAATSGFIWTACGGSDDAPTGLCGDGIVQSSRGEQCDDGAENDDSGPCRTDCTSCAVIDVESACLVVGAECGAVQALDNCGQLQQIDCGECSGENVCDPGENVCTAPSVCAIDTAPYCAFSRCGAATAIDNCNESVLFDCSDTEGVTVVDPLTDLTPISTTSSTTREYVGPAYPWDATHRIGVVEQGEVFLYLLFKSTLEVGQSGQLSMVTTTAIGDSCETDFCAIVAKRNDKLVYWYDSISGSATIVSLNPLRIEVEDAYFSEYVDASAGKSCLTTPVDFIYSYGITCDPNGVDEYNQQIFGTESRGYGYEEPTQYQIGDDTFDYDQVVYYYNSQDVYVYVELNNFWRGDSSGIPLSTPIAIDTLGGFDSEGYPYCDSQSCLMIYGDAQYNAYAGTIELTERGEAGLAGTVTDARFYMVEATSVAPEECQTPAIGFSFETTPGTYTTTQNEEIPYYRNYGETFSWTSPCTADLFDDFPPSNELQGKTYRLASPASQGWSELEFMSTELDPATDYFLVNINDYYGKAPPFTEGTLKTFNDYQLHPHTSDWEIIDGYPYCLSSTCLGYVLSGILYSPGTGSLSVTSIDTTFAGSVSDAIFYGTDIIEEEEFICIHSPVSFSFSGEIQSD
ncbi:MAG: hypothetical protein LBM75_01170 [Myxococcales bacterium]|nr:hypothetical protein [Myxococcales bacterium]